MVVSRAANSRTPTIKEALSSGGRSMSQRVSALPALSLRERLGFAPPPASAPQGAPSLLVKVHVAPSLDRPARRLASTYSRSYTEELPAVGAGRRRVRFALPSTCAPGDASAPRGGGGGGGSGGGISWPRAAAHPTSVSSVHGTARYKHGTLPPTSCSTPPPTGAGAGAGADPPPDLLRAAREADEAALRKYLEAADPETFPEDVANAADSSGRTAVSYIASTGSLSILEALVQIPTLDINRPDNEGNTPLHFAAQAGQVETLNFILSRCSAVEVDARNALGFTPLMKAALQGRTKCAKLLLFAGASPTLRDCGRGLRAEQWARYCGRHVCAEVIEKFSRHRLLERSTTTGRWGSEPELPPPSAASAASGLRSRIKRAFRTASSGDQPSTSGSGGRHHRYSLVSQLTSAALCASSPVLPASGAHATVRSLMRPLAVPKVQVTPAAAAPAPAPAPDDPQRPPAAPKTSTSSARQIMFKRK